MHIAILILCALAGLSAAQVTGPPVVRSLVYTIRTDAQGQVHIGRFQTYSHHWEGYWYVQKPDWEECDAFIVVRHPTVGPLRCTALSQTSSWLWWSTRTEHKLTFDALEPESVYPDQASFDAQNPKMAWPNKMVFWTNRPRKSYKLTHLVCWETNEEYKWWLASKGIPQSEVDTIPEPYQLPKLKETSDGNAMRVEDVFGKDFAQNNNDDGSTRNGRRAASYPMPG